MSVKKPKSVKPNPPKTPSPAKVNLDNTIKDKVKPVEFKDDNVKASQPGGAANSGATNVQASEDNNETYTNVSMSKTYRQDKNKTGNDAIVAAGVERPESEFNNFSLYNFAGTPFSSDKGIGNADYNKIDFGEKDIYQTPSVATIIQKTAERKALGYRYYWSDFALCKYLGKIPNNYMVTVRRFPYPVGDDIISSKRKDKDGNLITLNHPDIARAVTWMSEATGNKIEDILKFDFNYKWKNTEAEVQTLDSQTQARRGKFGSFIDNSTFLSAANAAVNGVDAIQRKQIESAGPGYDPLTSTYPNHVFGPYNSIRSVMAREGGMEFNHSFTLKFEYELRAIGDSNAKVMFLDQFANILALTYSNAPFWGGETRYLGGGQGSIGSPLGDLSKIKSGDYLGFLSSVGDQLSKQFGTLVNDIAKGFSGSKFLNNLIGGSLMDLFNSPQGNQIAQALLTGESTGSWHVTVGNPLNPIAVIGNLVLEKTEVNFKGPLGPMDFPDTLEVSLTLKPGRPRDKSEIESMFNAGRGRFYLTPEDGSDINKEHIVSERGESTKTPVGKLKPTRLGMSDIAFEEYKKLANG